MRAVPAQRTRNGLSSHDEALAALGDIEAALRDNMRRAEWALRRAEDVRRKRAAGMSYLELAAEGEPLIVTVVTENLQALIDAGSKLRRAHARALYAEGATLKEIGKLFGVSHQRVSALIHAED
jgi:hypothetical protein